MVSVFLDPRRVCLAGALTFTLALQGCAVEGVAGAAVGVAGAAAGTAVEVAGATVHAGATVVGDAAGAVTGGSKPH